MQEKVSIIVPVYNAKDYIVTSIQSLIQQSYKNIEIIIVNDGSTDESDRICDQLSKRDSRIIVIHTANRGVSAARNTGLKEATGEYIMFLDADDTVQKETIESALQIKQSLSVDTICWNYIKKYHDKEILSNPINPEQFIIKNKQMKEVIEALIYSYKPNVNYGSMFRAVWGKLFCTKIIKDNDIKFPEGLAIGEDAIFLISYFSYSCKVAVINKYWNKYTISHESTIGRYREDMLYIQLKEYKLIVEQLKKISFDIDCNTIMINFILQAERNYINNLLKKNSNVFVVSAEMYRYIINNNFNIPYEYNKNNLKKVDKIRAWMLKRHLFRLETIIDILIGIKNNERR